MTDARHWADVILAGAHDDGTIAVIESVNAVTAARRANIACVLHGCTQLLGQIIAQAGPDIVPNLRAAIMTLIDDYAMRATLDDGHD